MELSTSALSHKYVSSNSIWKWIVSNWRDLLFYKFNIFMTVGEAERQTGNISSISGKILKN